jgi:hypothetical protein
MKAPEPTPPSIPEVKSPVEAPIAWPEEEEEEFESSWVEPTPVPETANPLTPGLSLEPETPEPMDLRSAPPPVPEPVVVEIAQPVAPPVIQTPETPPQEKPPAPVVQPETRAKEVQAKPKTEGNAFMRSFRSVKKFIEYVDKPKAEEDPTRDIRGGAPIRLVGGVPVEMPTSLRTQNAPVTPAPAAVASPSQEEPVRVPPVVPTEVQVPEAPAPAPRSTGVEAYLSEMASQGAKTPEEPRVTPQPAPVTPTPSEPSRSQAPLETSPPVRQSTGVAAYLNAMDAPEVRAPLEEPAVPPVITPSFEPPQPQAKQSEPKKAPEGGVRKALFNLKRLKDYIDKPPHE